jgi:hypothetical protein
LILENSSTKVLNHSDDRLHELLQILGAETHFLADAIVRAYEARLAHPPKEGFSQEALFARNEILRGARDTLADPEWRGDYNQGLIEDEAGTLVVDVPWSKVYLIHIAPLLWLFFCLQEL